MDSRQAKDFLVQQVAEQATLERVPFTDLEQRMMYFTESDPASCGQPDRLNEEFEASYDTSQYELKASGLLERACNRLGSCDPERASKWEDAVKELRKGDHYLLVLLDLGTPKSFWRKFLGRPRV